MIKGNIFNIQRFSTHDGPGIRTTVFFSGCPMRCYWCQNPESQTLEPVLMHNESLCVGCGCCAEACKYGAIEMENGIARIDREKCVKCFECAKVCLHDSLTVSGRVVSVGEVMDEILKDRMQYLSSGGGVTLSGGEAAMQTDFAVALLEECKKKYIHTALETCGYIPEDKLTRLIPLVDLFFYDIKTMDSEKHKAGTGFGNELILRNAEIIASSGKEMHIRMPLIPGFNDSPEDVLALRDYVVNTLGRELENVELLKYNPLGEVKYSRLGMISPPHGEPQSDEYYNMLCSLLK